MPLHDFTKLLKIYEAQFMFNDFNWADYLSIIDDLIRVAKYGHYVDLIELTPRDLYNIATVISNKNRQETLDNAMGAGGGASALSGFDIDDLA